MGSTYRLFLYEASGWADNESVLEALETATGEERESLVEVLSGRSLVSFSGLDLEAARALEPVLQEVGVEFDLEPEAVDSDRVDWLAEEAPKWVKRGLVHPASIPRIFENYGAEAPELRSVAAEPGPASRPQLGTGTLLRAILALGGILVGVGLILFIAANWQKIPPAARIGGALGLSVFALGLGYWLRHGARPRPKLGATSFLIALFGIGGVVILLGQIYHLQADSYLLPLIWGGLAVPLALLLRFKPALYVASGLWYWAFWLYFEERSEAPWFYVALLLGFLLPYSLLAKDKRLYVTHVALLGLAILATVPMQAFWVCTALVLGLVALRVKFDEPVYDWLLVAGFAIWNLTWMMKDDDLPNLLYLIPLCYFFYRALRTESNALMIATVANAWVWLFITLLQTNEYFDLRDPMATGVAFWTLTTGLLWFGIGKRLEGSETWKALSVFLRFAGVCLAGLMIYAMSFRFYDDKQTFYKSWLMRGGALAFGAAALALAVPAVLKSPNRRARSGSTLLLALVSLSLVLSFVTAPALPLHVILFNLTLFAAALVFMFRGQRLESLAWYNAGIGLFVVLIASRYFDTLVDYLPRSIFFILGGLFLIAWVYFVDRQRRKSAAMAATEGGDGA